MVFSCKKYRHYLLANHFKFYIDHQALLYLVNKPCTTGRITRRLLLLQGFDFAKVVRKGKQHYMANHLSRIKTRKPPTGVNDELPDACLFKVDYTPEWYLGLVEYLMSGRPPLDLSKAKMCKLLRLAKH